ncbi:MAG: glutamate--cysteine ligase [Burkholderiales bacterium]|nr:glutamate--cysteine ligase [Burkholderiales bacterium]
MSVLEFKSSTPFTLGVELELQIVNRRDYDLSASAPDLLRLLSKQTHAGEIKPEITRSMLEISTEVHAMHEPMLAELRSLRDTVVAQAERLNLGIAGGGAHPFQHWSDRRIYDTPRFQHLSELYGYLAKQFTVFGQHIHIGCESGDKAVALVHALARYVPHFIVLSAASPFLQGVDTGFDSARLNSVNAFPLSGCMPMVRSWAEFEGYFDNMQGLKVVEGMKDFYWDIRPKPEFGTIEIRVCDTPLTVERAAALASFAQALARALVENGLPPVDADQYRVYGYNRFLACRFGIDAEIIDVKLREKVSLREDLLGTIDLALHYTSDTPGADALRALREDAEQARNGSLWLREEYKRTQSLGDVVRAQCVLWSGHPEANIA